MNDKLFREVDLYIANLLAKENKDHVQVTETLTQEKIPNASISPNQGKLLQVLAQTCGAKNILEIGTLCGYSTLWMAEALPSDGRIISIEADAHHARLAKDNVRQCTRGHQIEIREGQALSILKQIEEEGLEPFDMIFIDADKPPYLEYFQWAIKLSRAGSIIVADNVIRGGKVLDAQSIDEKVIGVQRLNTWLSACTTITATIIQTVGVKEHDGMVIAVVK